MDEEKLLEMAASLGISKDQLIRRLLSRETTTSNAPTIPSTTQMGLNQQPQTQSPYQMMMDIMSLKMMQNLVEDHPKESPTDIRLERLLETLDKEKQVENMKRLSDDITRRVLTSLQGQLNWPREKSPTLIDKAREFSETKQVLDALSGKSGDGIDYSPEAVEGRVREKAMDTSLQVIAKGIDSLDKKADKGMELLESEYKTKLHMERLRDPEYRRQVYQGMDIQAERVIQELQEEEDESEDDYSYTDPDDVIEE